MRRYYDTAFADGRLSNTIISIDNKLAYVRHIGEDEMCNFTWLQDIRRDGDGEKVIQIHIDDDAIDLTPIPLGNLNGAIGYARVERQPARRWKQGLNFGSLVWLFGPQYRLFDIRDGLIACFNNTYPSFEESVRASAQGVPSAFSRKWGVKMGHLVYKSTIVGDIEDGNPVLRENYSFLQEDLSEVLNAGA